MQHDQVNFAAATVIVVAYRREALSYEEFQRGSFGPFA
jgi:hypothetical protein